MEVEARLQRFQFRVNKRGGRGAGAAVNSVKSLISKEEKDNYLEKDRRWRKWVVWRGYFLQ